MKKIFLLALMLGLTGCGENGQNDNSQATATNQNLAIHAQPYSAATAPLLGGWSVTSTSAEGASLLLEAAKDTRVSAALITPNALDVAKVLRGGAAGIALSLAVDQILGAVDWVMDPANNQIKYKESLPLNPTDVPYVYCDFISVGNAICVAQNTEANALMIARNYGWLATGYVYCPNENIGDSYYQFRKDSCSWSNQGVAVRLTYVANPFYDPNVEEKTLSLDVVAEQVISNADNDNADAQIATNAAAQAILAEAYNDEAKAQPIVTELENNANDRCYMHNQYMNQQAGILQRRYNEMYDDYWELYTKYKPINKPLRGIGSWDGHVQRYVEVDQPKLRMIIFSASQAGCTETPQAQRWKQKAPPPQPHVHSQG